MSNLCNAYILVSGTRKITGAGVDDDTKGADERSKEAIFRNSARSTAQSAKLLPKDVRRTSPEGVPWTSLYGPLSNAKGRPLLTS